MKRKQFHLSVREEKILYEISKKKGISEAEVVRMALHELEKKELEPKKNPLMELVELGEKYAADLPDDVPTDLSVNHDKYLMEIYEDDWD